MTKEKLKMIIFNSIGLVWNDAWENLLYVENSSIPVRGQDLYNISSYGKKTGYLTFDYKELGMTFVRGEVSAAGIRLMFELEPYDYITISVDFYRMELVNYALIIPKYTSEHFEGRKSIRQTSNIVRDKKEFIRYKKRIDKRFGITY